MFSSAPDPKLRSAHRAMSAISTVLLLLIALTLAVVVGLVVMAPDGMVQNPPAIIGAFPAIDM
ncbi:hypothetical protein [Halalkalirubrum salinum]|uniref:hypothetical protein n=1 Tax=Halalkalirubrum salinum TaxID=2563889 RepID=UPI0010FAFD68|nr:hypothetical protein [Halalkalirubrum salinum]